jgi:hypothetical protein
MMTSTYGWRGKILKIDLSDLRINELDTTDYADCGIMYLILL